VVEFGHGEDSIEGYLDLVEKAATRVLQKLIPGRKEKRGEKIERLSPNL
jgi:hypothetical protein